jgi:hypothetical protein
MVYVVLSFVVPQLRDALLVNLPPGQTLLTSASGLPPKAKPDLVLAVTDGRIRPAAS